MLVVNDEPSVRRGLAMRLAIEPDLLVLGPGCSLEDVLGWLPDHRPDVALIDIDRAVGISVIAAVHRASPDTRIVVLTLQANPALIARSLSAGAHAVVEKSAGDAALLAAIR